MQVISSFFGDISAVDWSRVFAGVKTAFIVIDILVLVGVVLLWKESLTLRPRLAYPKKRSGEMTKQTAVNVGDSWMKILARTEKSQSPEVFALAIIEADKLLDETLRLLGFSGEYLTERLGQLERQGETKTIEKLWKAHRVRNSLVHARGFRITREQAREILSTYEDFFREIHAL